MRSGVNWMREKVRSHRVGQRAHQQRLAQAGHAFEQHVAAGEQRGDHALDDRLVADDDLADLVAQAPTSR